MARTVLRPPFEHEIKLKAATVGVSQQGPCPHGVKSEDDRYATSGGSRGSAMIETGENSLSIIEFMYECHEPPGAVRVSNTQDV